MAKGVQIREKWKATAKPWEQQALFNGQVARRVNSVTVDGGEGEWRDDGLYINIFDRSPMPFAVALDYNSGSATWSYTITDALALWWTSDGDNYVTLYEASATSTVTLPASGQYACLYAKVTCDTSGGGDGVVAMTYGVAADAATIGAAVQSAAAESTGHNGCVRIMPLAIIGHLGDLYVLHRGVWNIGRES